MSFCRMVDLLFVSVSLFFFSISLSLSVSCSVLNLDLKVSEEPHGVHLKAKAAAGEHSGQHSGELFSRKQVLPIHRQTKKYSLLTP